MLTTGRKFKIVYITLLLLIFPLPLWIMAGNTEQTLSEGSDNDALIMLIVYVSLALGFSFLCSIAEAVLLSITPSYIEAQKAKRPKFAKLIKRLKQEEIDKSLAAILTLNTIAHTVGAIGAGAQATVLLGSAWFGLFSAIMTLMILFLSEIVPKTVGALYWSTLARPTAVFVFSLIYLLYPIVWVSEKLTKFISRGKNMHIFSREEFIAMARLGEQSGHLPYEESRIIRNLFRFGSLNASDIMTPSTVIFALPEGITVKMVMKDVVKSPFSRILLYKEDIDDTTGFILRDDILLRKAQGKDEEILKSMKRDIAAIPETISVSLLLERFLKEREHIALVVDEHGATRGLVTLEDIIETLLGAEIVDELDKIEDMRILARRLWRERARALGISDNLKEGE
jgi:CBS domain containing-hemolysin-like protein